METSKIEKQTVSSRLRKLSFHEGDICIYHGHGKKVLVRIVSYNKKYGNVTIQDCMVSLLMMVLP